ncbi:MAG: isoprenylcysteine carboxylmethyltransferase family protein [Dehalococcoidia bacterium]|nr:MAG: isoprenylcysteine carboxylmethyltransferase family protein [Dehalococcoidia bacterium]
MGLGDRWAETVYRIATTKGRRKILLTPLGLIFWFGLSVLLVFASLALDGLLPVRLPFFAPVSLSLGWLLVVLGGSLCLGTVYSFSKARGSPVPLNPPQKLVTTGLYSRVRNPMLVGWFIMLFGLGILLHSIFLIFIFTPLFILLNALYLKNVEEKEMEKKFGQDYLNYKKSVPMFIPRFGRRS